MRSRSRNSSHIAFPALVSVLLLLPALVSAQIPVTDPVPWALLDDGPAVRFTAERFDDGDSGWRAERLGLLSSIPFGAGHRFFLSWRHVAFSSDGLDVLERWPGLVGEDAPADWPGEDRSVGWGRPGFGVVGVTGMPLLGRTGFAVAAQLPLGSDALYPFSGRSLPLQFQLRRACGGSEGWRAGLRVGAVLHLDSPGDELSSEAFPTLTVWGGDLGWRGTDGRSLRLDARLVGGGGAHSSVLSLRFEVPAGGASRFFLAAARELADDEARAWRTGFQVGWTLLGSVGPDGPGPEDDPQSGRR